MSGFTIKSHIRAHVITILRDLRTPVNTCDLFERSGLHFDNRKVPLTNQVYWFQAILDELEARKIVKDLRTGETGAHQYILREE